MPVDIYAALGALVRAEAARDRERPAAADRQETTPECATAPDAPAQEPRELTERHHE
ncbi:MULTISPECIES: hypothetical protein [unclassified Streptomyces]|uniref:hypothetical protein n=1 Tax=unclassified Streptomyces TaxID=2593676 RepID=UPI00035E5D90|nr:MULTISPECIES: hypothetical protein [unclassified Streptomyces]MYX33621.1 hypothetical protein [Streptomyces sp. SID8377]